MVIRVSDKTQNYSKVTKLLVKPLKINIKKICDKHGIDASVESCAFGEALSYLPNTDLVITSPEWSSMLPPSNAVLAQTKNLIDTDGVEQTLLEAVKEHFPDELKG